MNITWEENSKAGFSWCAGRILFGKWHPDAFFVGKERKSGNGSKFFSIEWLLKCSPFYLIVPINIKMDVMKFIDH